MSPSNIKNLSISYHVCCIFIYYLTSLKLKFFVDVETMLYEGSVDFDSINTAAILPLVLYSMSLSQNRCTVPVSLTDCAAFLANADWF
jgi:hypothetical protein